MAVILLFSVFTIQYAAKADVSLLAKESMSLFAGDSLSIADYFIEYALEEVQEGSLQYAVSQESSNPGCITLTTDGMVTAVSKGTATVEVTYIQKDTQLSRTESFQVTVLPPEQIAAECGTTVWLTAFDMYYPSVEEYTYSFSGDSAVMAESGEGVIIQGFQNTIVYLEKAGVKIPVAEITVKVPQFARERMGRALDTEAFYPEIENYIREEDTGYVERENSRLEEPVWSIDDEEIVSLSEEGFQVKKKGSTVITAKFTAYNGDELVLTLHLTVTDPKLKKDYVVVAVGGVKKLPISGVCDDSSYEAGKVMEGTDRYQPAGSEFSHSYLNEAGKICGETKGTEKAVLFVDGRILHIQIVITDPYYAKNTFTMYKGLKKSVTIKGIDDKYSTVSFTSTDTEIASVTNKGKVTAKKVGTVKLKVKADGRTVDVWVEISTKKALQAAKKGIAISNTKTQYSQAKRMSAGYYDCSSLVSRVYRQFGVYFGSKSGWSPTAAAIGQWCTTNGKVIAKKGVDYTKLVPGDLVFYSYTKNGRYLNISHVEMYVGNGMSVSASSSNNRVIHYAYRPDSAVLIARPTE